jgi:cytochrome c peroxidase
MVAGFTNAPTGPGQTRGPVQGTCSTCHNEIHGGNSSQPDAQFATGIGGVAAGFGGPPPATTLPIFKLTCSRAHPPAFASLPGGRANPPYVLTNDPGKALITGKCADIGRFTAPSLHGLAARAPYFSDGSASDLVHVVMFYDRRFKLGLTKDEYADLINFLDSL